MLYYITFGYVVNNDSYVVSTYAQGMSPNGKEAIRQAFSKRFTRALKELGYAPEQQKQLGELFDVSGQGVQKWAEGVAMPTATRMPHVADVLGVRQGWLQYGEEPMRSIIGKVADESGDYETMTISGDEVDLLLTYRELSPQQRKVLKGISTILLENTVDGEIGRLTSAPLKKKKKLPRNKKKP